MPVEEIEKGLDIKHFWRLLDSEHIGHGEWYYIGHGLMMYDLGKLHAQSNLIWSIIVVTVALNILFWGICWFKRKRGVASIVYTDSDAIIFNADKDPSPCHWAENEQDGSDNNIKININQNLDLDLDPMKMEEQKYDNDNILINDL